MVRLALGYPEYSDEQSLVLRKQSGNLLDLVEPVLKSDELEAMRAEVDKIYVDKKMVEYIVSLITATRNHPHILLGGSPRATLALTSMSKAMAYMQSRDYIIPDDIPPIFTDTLSHRMIMRPSAASENVTVEDILSGILKSVPVPQVTA